MLRKILYGVVNAGNCYNAYAPDYPGCLATGNTAHEAKQRLVGTLKAHIKAMVDDGEELPHEDIDGGFVVVDIPATSGHEVTGKQLKAYRTRMGLTQEEMAAKLEVTKATISEWETGKRPLPGTVKFALETVG